MFKKAIAFFFLIKKQQNPPLFLKISHKVHFLTTSTEKESGVESL